MSVGAVDARAGGAARNNAAWCDAVCRAHGRSPRFEPHVWCHDGPGLRFYPNLVTLDPGVATAAVAPWVERLCTLPDTCEFGVKDSFARLDLAPQGLALLFEAQWIHRAAPATREAPAGLHWAVVDSDAMLAGWEAAWWRAAGEPATHAPMFPPALLRSPGITLLAGCAGDEVVAGCALTLDDTFVGMSCNFHGPLDPHAALHETLAEIHLRHPARPIVGYETGADLARACDCGFEPVGLLRVWLRPSPATPS